MKNVLMISFVLEVRYDMHRRAKEMYLLVIVRQGKVYILMNWPFGEVF